MEDRTRRHERITESDLDGFELSVSGILPGPAVLFVPERVGEVDRFDILLHFHGSAFIAHTAAARSEHPIVAANVHLGSGSSVYERPFLDTAAFPLLLQTVEDSLSQYGLSPPRRIFLSAFSAGYGAVRAILKLHADLVDGVLLLDGLHADYEPAGLVLNQGGRLDDSDLMPFVSFARIALTGGKRMLITHSEIFPGTFASTTETTDYIIEHVGLNREAVLEWGPGGMQLLSRVQEGRFTVLGFAGNTAPDHVDHFHALPNLVALLIEQ
jgi:hypothetical protein